MREGEPTACRKATLATERRTRWGGVIYSCMAAYRSSSFCIMSTTSSGSVCMFFRLRSMVRPGRRSLLTPLASAVWVSLSLRATLIASLAIVITRRGEGGDVAWRDTFAGASRKIGMGGTGGFDAVAADTAAARRAWAGFSGNPRGRSIVEKGAGISFCNSILSAVEFLIMARFQAGVRVGGTRKKGRRGGEASPSRGGFRRWCRKTGNWGGCSETHKGPGNLGRFGVVGGSSKTGTVLVASSAGMSIQAGQGL